MVDEKFVEAAVKSQVEIMVTKKLGQIVEQKVKDYLEDVLEEDNEDVEYENAPPLLELTDEEKFKDTNGNIIDIETLGEKHRNKIYFKVKDVSVAFGMDGLNKTLLNKDRGYVYNDDYKRFNREITFINDEHKTTNKKKQCRLYLTYHGFLRVLFVSRNDNVKNFQDWAEEKLFTIQMGSKEEKTKLGTEILNIPMKAYKAVFESHADKLPSMYLFKLGKVCDLRETFHMDDSISDSSCVYKFGCTDDLTRRFGETVNKYNKLQNVKTELVIFRMVDTKHTFDAENDIREQCKAYGKNLNVAGYNELIVLSDKEFEYIKKSYRRIGNEYAGATAELQKQVLDLEKKIEDLVKCHKYELLEKEMELQNEKNKNKALETQIVTDTKYNELKFQYLTLQIENLKK